jgi:hypothetical protein
MHAMPPWISYIVAAFRVIDHGHALCSASLESLTALITSTPAECAFSRYMVWAADNTMDDALAISKASPPVTSTPAESD